MGGQFAQIRPATERDARALFALVSELAEYEGLAGEMTGGEELLVAGLFGGGSTAEALVAEVGDELQAKRMEQWRILRLEGGTLHSLATERD